MPAWRPLRLLAVAALWIVLAFLAGIVARFAIGFASGFVAGLHRLSGEGPLAAAIAPVGAIALQGGLLLGALSNRRPPRGAGLGAGPIRRRWLLPVLIAAQLGGTVAWMIAVLTLFGAPRTAVADLLRSASGDPLLLGVLGAIAVLLAPVCEELFFRGWLWTALRRHWGPVATGLTTAVPWLVLHGGDGGWRRVLVLVPTALLLSVTREVCASVRASLAMHICNNAAVAIVLAALLRYGN